MNIKKKILAFALATSTVFSITPALAETATQTVIGPTLPIPGEQQVLDFYSMAQKEQAMVWGNQFYQKWMTKISPIEKQQLIDYTGNGYYDINAYLRTNQGNLPGHSLATEEKIKHMDRAMQAVPLEDSIKVYRRVDEKAFGLQPESLIQNDKLNRAAFESFKQKFSGKYKTDFAYMSTAILKDASPGFSGYPILFRITVPKGIDGVYLAPLSHFPDEMELLLARNMTYQVKNISVVKEQQREYVLIDATITKAQPKSLHMLEETLPSLSK
ncbi:ADP-ribosyltransferase [Bacillus thuringiensis]|uniref:ADP-ribosyltransferase n=1 Tax=Bacillus thuringiensis TaxID=1428 RepID=UPI0016424A78|nr:ADP-ribosyltransferase [Bacillus thuringiensis]